MNEYVPRLLASKIEEVQKYYPVTVVTGPRQSGKTSLCRHLFHDYAYYNMEDVGVRSFAQSDPVGFIDSLPSSVILDEVQNVPELLSMIQVRVDEDRTRRYILTGSSNFSLLHRISQSLAGRAALFTLLPFSCPEIKADIAEKSTDELLFRGQYPGVVANGIPPAVFYGNYYNTYVERDIRDLLKVKNIVNFDKFIRLLASRVGSELNASALAREVGVSSVTIGEWYSILQTGYICYSISPYYANISKRLTKMPKVYFYDTGLLCYLLGLMSPEGVAASPLRGAVFENFAMGELLKRRINMAMEPNLQFYREHSGREVDALINSDGLHLYEIKSAKTFRKEFTDNTDYLKGLLPDVKSVVVVYDGQTMSPSLINVRDI